MSTATLQKNYKRLENRLENLEQVIKEFFGGELKGAKLRKLEKISKRLDGGYGHRFSSYKAFQRHLKAL